MLGDYAQYKSAAETDQKHQQLGTHTFNLRRPQKPVQPTDFGLQCLDTLHQVLSNFAAAAVAAVDDHRL